MTRASGSAAEIMAPVAARISWDGLPEQVRAAVHAQAGEVYQADTITSGLNSAFTARLRTSSGVVFTKGVRSDRAAAQRREADVNPHVQPFVPRLRWQVDIAGWHLLGFDHLDGRSANLGPESADLQALADALGRLAELEAPGLACKRIEDRWAEAARLAGTDAGLLAGSHLLHTDLNPHNIMLTGAGVRFVDWSWPTLGAPWIDTACAALWLIAEGHTPADAEAWAAEVQVWSTAAVGTLDAFAAINAALWRQIADAEPCPWKRRLQHAATAWTEYRERKPHRTI
jgi:hypothetical protein